MAEEFWSSEVWLVGPTHPYTGGIAQHTTRLALELEDRGITVGVESWAHQYPTFLYRGTPRVSRDEPEIGVPSRVREKLRWYSPVGWFRAGRRLRSAKRVIVSIPTAFHAFPYEAISWGLGANRGLWGIVHNVIPHDSGSLSRRLMGWFLRRLDHVIVHSELQRELAIRLGVEPRRISAVTLPSPWPGNSSNTGSHQRQRSTLHLIFFGTVRPYKGLDLLLESLARTTNISLTVAGEFWDSQETYENLIRELELTDRVTLCNGYVPASQMPIVFDEKDCLILPYRSGTASIVREVGFRFGLPVIATAVGAVAEGIKHDVNGWVIPTPTVEAITDALNQAKDPRARKRWRAGVASQASQTKEQWEAYCLAVLRPDALSPQSDEVR